MLWHFKLSYCLIYYLIWAQVWAMAIPLLNEHPASVHVEAVEDGPSASPLPGTQVEFWVGFSPEWSSPGYYGYLGSESADWKFFFLSFPFQTFHPLSIILPLYKSFKKINMSGYMYKILCDPINKLSGFACRLRITKLLLLPSHTDFAQTKIARDIFWKSVYSYL